jgi:hypothetical protein
MLLYLIVATMCVLLYKYYKYHKRDDIPHLDISNYRFIENNNNTQKIKSDLIKDFYAHSRVLRPFVRSSLYMHESIDISPITLYEYIVRDTYFNKDVESIIKEYLEKLDIIDPVIMCKSVIIIL